jgi:hypothetical protein
MIAMAGTLIVDSGAVRNLRVLSQASQIGVEDRGLLVVLASLEVRRGKRKLVQRKCSTASLAVGD